MRRIGSLRLSPAVVVVCVGLAAGFGGVAAVALAMPHRATASHKNPASVPDCFDFSAGKLAALLHEHSLRFDGGTHRPDESECSWLTPRQPGRYRDIVSIGITATNVSVFDSEKRAARQQAARTGADFGTNLQVRGAAKVFYTTQDFSNQNLPPCQPGYKLPAFGPPQCFPEPDWTEIAVSTYGSIKPSEPKAFVKVAFGAQNRVAEPTGVSHLNKEILSGQLR